MPKTPEAAPAGQFVRVGESLYRYSPNRMDYAVLKNRGKIFRHSLKTTDRPGLRQARTTLDIEVLGGRRAEALTAMESFGMRFKPTRKLLVWGQGIELAGFL